MAGPLSGSVLFEIKPALLAGRRVYDIAGGMVICRDPDGHEHWRVDLRAVTHAAFVDHTIRGQHMWRFDLVCGAERYTIAWTHGVAGAAQNPDRAVFVDLVAALCQALDTAQPGFEAGLGEYGRYRMLWFAVGVLSLLSGAGILIAAIATGVSLDRLATASVGLGLLMLLGLFVIRAYHPWQTPPKVPVATLAQIVRVWAGRGK